MPVFPFGHPPTEEEIVGLSYYDNSPVETEADIPVPLESVTINAVIVHVAALVDIRQKYVYKKKVSVEGAYTFPLVPAITVTQFRVEINGRIVKGVVKANEEAKKQYIKALEEHRMNLLREIKTDEEVFRIDIGNIEPEDEIIVHLSYITELLRSEIGTDSIRFIIPKAVAPNYNVEEKEVSSSSRKPSANVAIKVTVSLEGHLNKLESPSHNVSVSKIEQVPGKICWTRAFVDVRAKAKDMNRDFVLLITQEEVDRPRVYTERIDANSIAVMAYLVPKLEIEEQKVELIVALDPSGSMGENKLKSIEIALQTFLHSIPDDSYFNVVGFGNMYESLFSDSVQYTNETLSLAETYIKNMAADLVDTTHLYDLVQAIFSKNPIPGYFRQVFLLTGSPISNDDKILALIHSNCHNTRVFCLGIGEGVSQLLVNNIAKAGNGSSEFIREYEQVDSKLLDQLKIALQPSLTDIHVKWNGLVKPLGPESFQAPDKIPPVFKGFPLIIYGIFADEIPTGISISGTSPDGILSVKVPIDEERDAGDLGLISKLAVMKIIRELEKRTGTTVSDITAFCAKENPPTSEAALYQQRIKDIIVYLGCGNGIISKYTSYVMMDESRRTESFHGTIQQRNIPLQPRNSCKKSHCCIDAQYTCLECIDEKKPKDDFFPGPGPSKLRSFPNVSCANELPANSQVRLGETDLRSLLEDYKVPLRTKSLCAKKSENISKYINVDSFRQELDIDGFRDDLSTMRSASRFDAFTDSEDDENYDGNLVKSPVYDIASLQNFSGCFLLTDDLCEAISIPDLYFLELEARNNNWDETAWATVLAITYLSKKLPHLKRSWELLSRKGNTWLMKNHTDTWHSMSVAAHTLF